MTQPTRRRLGLLGRFTVLAIGAMLFIGVLLTIVLGREARDTALKRAALFAESRARTAVSEAVGDDRIDDGLGPATIEHLDRLMARDQGDAAILRMKVWALDGTVVYSDAHELIGQRFDIGDDLRTAMADRTHAGISSGTDGEAEHVADMELGDLLEVYVPLYNDVDPMPTGVAETYYSYAPVAREIAAVRRRVTVVVAGGLAVLMAILLPIVASASRRLRRQARHNEHLAFHDPLTGLPNRREFVARVEHALGSRKPGAVAMLLDLDGFKDVNDTLGHADGDVLLKQVAQRLDGVLDDRAHLARLGGDEFGVVCDVPLAIDQAERIARGMLGALDDPFQVGDVSVSIAASVGIAHAPEHGSDVSSLLRRADIAMYAAKRGRRGVLTYLAEHEPEGREFITLVSDLRRAIAAGQLRLHYQPKAELHTRRVRSVEALVRWEHPQRGLLSPGVFIDFAERANLIGPLTEWVLEEALGQCRRWADQGLRLSVAVNISQMSLADPELPRLVATALERHGLPAQALEIEVTESALATDLDAAAAVLGALHDLGIRVAIDDYGTGFASIAHLRRLPIDAIKIDRAYISTMLEDEKSASIVRSTVDLARDLEMSVVAEGVETEQEWNALGAFPGLLVQGFLVSRPLPADALASWLGNRDEIGDGESSPEMSAWVADLAPAGG